ncbi:MAG: FAD-binding oxidoreductase [Elusimicrobia bacterium]|nr:FAD-binding oxidoreductase [Candidatus Omnitrophota bacterium]MCG2725009.1 FAD-binding oxidoreductase [Elusimicrobiota bacterium]
MFNKLTAAIEAWRRALGESAVLTDTDSVARFSQDTGRFKQSIPAVLRPATVEQVISLLKIAGKWKVPVYPISTGRNWGYGTANPVTEGCALVDLSAMNRILALDAATGLATLEPGVTQSQLRNVLDQHKLHYLVPVTGAGPDCSLVGNAVERGYGITPNADHFGAVTWLEAVLPNGDLYQGALSGLGCSDLDHSFKWGMGPYLDGLFTQGAFGIITKMTIALAPIPTRTEAFFFSLPRDCDLEGAVEAVRDVLTEVGSISGSINLMNARRMMSMTESYPRDIVPQGSIMSDNLVIERSRRYQICPWTGVGALYGDSSIVKAAKSLVRKRLRGHVKRLMFFTPSLARLAHNFTSVLPQRGGRLGKMTENLNLTLQLLSGEPSEIALPLAYWKSMRQPLKGNIDPARDGCGLTWYSPLVPMSAERVRNYVTMVETICRKHQIEPLITLTSLSPRVFDSTVPILFDANNPEESDRADACYRELFETGRTEGYLPYRMGVQYMNLVTGADTSYWRLVQSLKQTVDPDDILAPGRYCPPY